MAADASAIRQPADAAAAAAGSTPDSAFEALANPAVPVYGVSGLWGLIALGLFANGKHGGGLLQPDGAHGASWNGLPPRERFIDAATGSVDGVRGLFYGDASQLAAQMLAAITLVLFGFSVSYLFFKVIIILSPMRTTKDAKPTS